MRNSLYKFVILLAFFVGTKAYAQQIAACQNAQNACDNPGFQLTPGGTGLPGNLNVSNPGSNPQGVNSGCLFTNGPSPNWMIITVGSSGMLGFSFGANGSAFPQTGLYDWAMWAYDPNTTCNGIFNNTLPPVACNWNGSGTGGTGMGTPPPGGSSSNYQPSIPVTAGQQFIILLSNYSGITASVTIQNNGTAGLACSPLIMPSVIRCPNQQTVLTGTWAAAALTNVMYTLTPVMPPSSLTSTVSANPSFTVSTPTTKSWTLLASGINSINAIVTASTVVTITTSPTIKMDVVASPNPTTAIGAAGNVCYNTPATFTALGAGTGYTLTGPNNLMQLSGIPIITSPSLTASGSYTIATTLFSGCTATGAVLVNVSPNHNISVITLTNVCMDAAVTLTANMPTATLYSWNGPNSFVGAGAVVNIPNMQVQSAGGYTVNASINFNGITCPRRSVTQVNVVQTFPVDVAASPNDTLCQGDNLSLFSGSTGTNAVYNWKGPNSFNMFAQNAGVGNILPVHAGVYTVTASFSNGQLTCNRTNDIRISVIATAFPTLTMPSNICQNTDAVFSVSATANPIAYSWAGPNNFYSATQQFTIDSVQPPHGGQYFGTAYFAIGGTKICSKQVSGQMNVVPVNSISVVPPEPVCRPDNAYLYSSAIAATSYTWTGPNNFLDYQNNAVVYNPPVSSSGIYTVRAGFGGGALTCYNTTTVSLTVNPVINFNLPQNPRPYCYDDVIHINGPAGATSYTWTSSTGYTSNNKDLHLTKVQPENSGIYTLSVSLGPCVTRASTNLEILSRIKLDEAVVPRSITVCKEAPPSYFMADAIGGSKNYAFTWNPESYLSSPTGSYIVANPKGTVVYNVTGYDIACPHYSVSYAFTVTVKSAPEPKLVLEKTASCQPLCLFYNPDIEKKQNAVVFYEFVNEATGASRKFQVDSNSNYSTDYCIPDAGKYKVRITTTILTDDNLRCSETFEQPWSLEVYPKPGSDILWTPENPTLEDNTVTFNAVSKHDAEILSWDIDGFVRDSVVEISPVRVFENSGQYAVILVTQTTDWGCYDTIVRFLDVKDNFNVYIPNVFTPNNDGKNDVFMAKGSAISQDGFSMEIFDVWGTSLFYTTNPQTGWDGTNKKGEIAQNGTYTYRIVMVSDNKDGQKEFKGVVILMK
ncbi:MAG: gliding motility-associated C-terminal domain-containing protein [Bacteroidetes bacterium]|nr:gliding motility-associated C-terminal domain-containing protein [Bacteroidota bacterium]